MKASSLDIIILEQNRQYSVLLLPSIATSGTTEVSSVATIPHHLFLNHGDFFVATPRTYNLCHCSCLQIDLQYIPYLVCSGVSLFLDEFKRSRAGHVTMFLFDSLNVGAVRGLRPTDQIVIL